jgi:catechol 2,3-dioxygenase-like lactoylglutathione lyase family enzyme
MNDEEAKPIDPLLRKIGCLQNPVPDLEAGLAFYRDSPGQPLLWRTATVAGLRLQVETGLL